MALKRLFQLCFGRESQPGVLVPSLVAAGNAKLLIIDPQLTYDVEEYERQIIRGTFSPLKGIAGVVEANLTFSLEVSGSTDATVGVGPVWGPLLEACGLRQGSVRGGDITTPFTTLGAGNATQQVMEQNETIVQITALDTGTPVANTLGRVVMDVWQGQTKIRYFDEGSVAIGTSPVPPGPWPVRMVMDGENIETTVSNITDLGQSWIPESHPQIALGVSALVNSGHAANQIYIGTSSGAVLLSRSATLAAAAQPFRLMDGTVNVTGGETLENKTVAGADLTIAASATVSQTRLPTLSFALIEDSVVKTIKACRGTFSMSGNIGEPLILSFEFKGVLVSIVDGTAVSGVTYTSPVPPKFMGVELKLGSYDAGEPGFDDYATEHTPRVRGFSIDYGGEIALQRDATQTTGVVITHITGRNPTGSLDPEIRPEAAYPFLDKFVNGEVARLRLRWGTSNLNRFMLTLPAIKATSEAPGDDDGLAKRDLQFRCSSRKRNGAEGENREFALHYSRTMGQF